MPLTLDSLNPKSIGFNTVSSTTTVPRFKYWSGVFCFIVLTYYTPTDPDTHYPHTYIHTHTHIIVTKWSQCRRCHTMSSAPIMSWDTYSYSRLLYPPVTSVVINVVIRVADFCIEVIHVKYILSAAEDMSNNNANVVIYPVNQTFRGGGLFSLGCCCCSKSHEGRYFWYVLTRVN